MIKIFKTKFSKKRVFINTFIWKNFGLYYSLPISYKYKLKFPEFKVSYRFRGYYYEKVVEDNIYAYSNGFQKDTFERLKTISMIKKHRRRLWINDRNEYLAYTLCDMLRISYKDNEILRFVVRYKIIGTSYWIFNFFPRKNYKYLISQILKKQNLLSFFYKVLKFYKKKLYSFFKSNSKSFLYKKDSIFLLKIIWKSPKFILLTASGYRFIRKGLYWLNLGIFTGLFYIIKGDAKIGVAKTLIITYLMFIYYNNLFLFNIKNIEIYFNLLLYNKYQLFISYLMESTYELQKIKFRWSNRVLTRWHYLYIKTFLRIQVKFFNYFKNNYLSTFENMSHIGNFFFYSKYFEYLNDFENSLFKDRNKLLFVKNYTLQEKVLIFKTIVHLLQFDTYKTKVKYLTLKNFYNYFIKKHDIFYFIFAQIKTNFFVFNQFYFKGFFLNNFISRIYINWPLSKRKGVLKFSLVGNKEKIMFLRGNYFTQKNVFLLRFRPKKHKFFSMFRKFKLKRFSKLFYYYKKLKYLHKMSIKKILLLEKNEVNIEKINIKSDNNKNLFKSINKSKKLKK